MPWEEEGPTAEQALRLTKAALWTERVTRGYAAKLIERLDAREALGLASPKQVALLRKFGEPNSDIMTKRQAGYFISQRMK